VTGCATVTNGQRCGHSKDDHWHCGVSCTAPVGYGFLPLSGRRQSIWCPCPGYTDPKENQ
jgi:hypothetical protein